MSYSYVLPSHFNEDNVHKAFQLAKVHASLHHANTGQPEPAIALTWDTEIQRFAIGFEDAVPGSKTAEATPSDKVVEDYAEAKYRSMDLRTSKGEPMPRWNILDPEWRRRWLTAGRHALTGTYVSWTTLATATIRNYEDELVRNGAQTPDTIEQRAMRLFHMGRGRDHATPVSWWDQPEGVRRINRIAALDQLAREEFERQGTNPAAARWVDMHPIAQAAYRMVVEQREP